MYARNKSYDKAQWKHEVRTKFRKGILDYLNDQFVFYQILIPEYFIDEFIERHYRKITGKVFSFNDTSEKRVLVYAERKTQLKGNGMSYKYDETKDAHVDKNILVIPGKGKEQRYKVDNIILGENDYQEVRSEDYALVDQEKADVQEGTQIIPFANREYTFNNEVFVSLAAEDEASYDDNE